MQLTTAVDKHFVKEFLLSANNRASRNWHMISSHIRLLNPFKPNEISH